MSRLPVFLLLTLSLFCFAHADVEEQSTTPCKLYPYGHEHNTIECSNVTDFSDVIHVLTSADQRVHILKIEQSPQLVITRADMDNPAFGNLNRLRLKGNSMTTFNSEPFRGLTHLKWLNLNNNNLSSIAADTFVGLETINGLLIEDNQITNIDVAAFKVFNNLTELYLTENKLTSINERLFEGLELTTLNIDDNLLTSLDARIFTGLSKLTLLRLSGNKFKSFSTGTFDPLTSLYALDLSRTQLESLESGLFENTHILMLRLEGINMEHIENFHMNIPTLETLSLKNCNIHTITAQFFEHLPNLKGVLFDSNKISKIDENLFTHLPELRAASFKINNLTSLSVSSFHQMHQILKRLPTVIEDGIVTPYDKPQVLLKENPWNCQTDEMKELRDWMGAYNLAFNDYFDCTN